MDSANSIPFSDLRTRNLFHTDRKQPDGFNPFFTRQPRHIHQAIPVVAKVFKTLDAIETNAALFADIDEVLGFAPVSSAIPGLVNDSPRTYPTIAAMNGDMPGNRLGRSLALSVSIRATFYLEDGELAKVTGAERKAPGWTRSRNSFSPHGGTPISRCEG
jgi:hypothetical protein